MIDIEVERTLQEIRDSVRAQLNLNSPRDDAGDVASVRSNRIGGVAESLSLIEANLVTVDRAWDRLPPLSSNRQGTTARIELWIKGKLKRATRWFTWEQVNLNHALLESIRETVSLARSLDGDLMATREELDALRQANAELGIAIRDSESAILNRLRNSISDVSATIKSQNLELSTRITTIETNLTSKIGELRDLITSAIDERRSEIEALKKEREGGLDSSDRQQAAIRSELLDRISHVSEEQRVCFKQLSLEAVETNVKTERVRSEVEAKLSEIANLIRTLETLKKDLGNLRKRSNRVVVS
jgi:hypothetical protein